ncbi:uncharacterized protein LOC123874024 [Maniola jurtina]|uniref:uncharacterized protein LOC123874024 n=1 Tax=Maniola jurtina TaxID=191418 RepID=UPI001E688D9D|nr:uncharacterized protein LOC123874024 [Maniola jurtina]
MVVRVGINGFGRIGRVIFRTCFQNKDLEVSAINDPAVDIEYICYLIKFDSTHGKFKSDVSFSDNEICIDDKKIKVFSEKLPSSIPWQSADVHYVVEASGMFTNLEKALGHLANKSVKRVIVTAPTVDVPMLILGVNEEQINADQKVVSCASSTLYCLAPIVKILEDKYGVAEGFITSIHAMTPSLKPLDGLCLKGKHWRDHRSIHQNIIPAATGACRALGKIIPTVKDKLTGLAFRVPIVNVSVLDITVRLTKDTTIQDIIKCIETESKSTMTNIIKISKDQEVSSDFLSDKNSCIFDANSSLQLNPKFFKLICWYENEYSYACRVVDSIKYFEENHCKLALTTKIPFDRIVCSNQTIQRKVVPDFSKEYIVSNCYMPSNPKILFSSSKGTGFKAKSLQRQVTYEKAASLRNSGSNQLALRETKKSNDIFKVWNDEVQVSTPLIKENTNSFFQSCVLLGPTYIQNNNYQDTRERLEEVKKEFSKMVDMTENLLNKPNKNKCKINILKEKLENEVGKENTKQKSYNTRATLPTDGKTDVPQTSFSNDNEDLFTTHNKENADISMVKNTSEFYDLSNAECKKQNQYLESKCNENIICFSSKTPGKKSLTLSDSEGEEEVDSSRANEELVNQQNLGKTMCNPQTTSKLINNNINPNKTESFDNKADLGSSDILTEKLNQHDFQHDEVKKEISQKNCSDMILTNKDDKISSKRDLNNTELTVTYTKPESSKPEDGKITKRDEKLKKIIEGIMKILIPEALEDKTRSPSLVNTNTTISNGEANKSLDIYDKIDSASGTDSENSFQLNEKTSQVIDIKDLTSSAEEMARLDKICRIIEISDEMSDKLFSALNYNDENIRKKKWSFKDLCERLKLDEFCNNVFGSQN